jgi:hypothetical protein
VHDEWVPRDATPAEASLARNSRLESANISAKKKTLTLSVRNFAGVAPCDRRVRVAVEVRLPTRTPGRPIRIAFKAQAARL